MIPGDDLIVQTRTTSRPETWDEVEDMLLSAIVTYRDATVRGWRHPERALRDIGEALPSILRRARELRKAEEARV